MKTDKELLELAAKAWMLNCFVSGMSADESAKEMLCGKEFFNPLNDDGDALRLAVKLDIAVIQDKENGCAIYISGGDSVMVRGDDPYAATRRAIVRAAAAIGEKL